MSILTISGSTTGGGGLPVGRLRLTECNWMGMVMISITSSTSITSISGVVLMSIMTSMSDDLDPTFIDIAKSSCGRCSQRLPYRRLGDERDLRNSRALACVDHATDAGIAAVGVTADLHFGLWRQHGHLLQPVDQRIRRLHLQLVPVDAVVDVHRDRDGRGVGVADLVALCR